jgi:hypothetical protein
VHVCRSAITFSVCLPYFVCCSFVFGQIHNTLTPCDTQLLPMQIVASTFVEYDKDGDGKLDFFEFQKLVTQGDLDSTVLP